MFEKLKIKYHRAVRLLGVGVSATLLVAVSNYSIESVSAASNSEKNKIFQSNVSNFGQLAISQHTPPSWFNLENLSGSILWEGGSQWSNSVITIIGHGLYPVRTYGAN